MDVINKLPSVEGLRVSMQEVLLSLSSYKRAERGMSILKNFCLLENGVCVCARAWGVVCLILSILCSRLTTKRTQRQSVGRKALVEDLGVGFFEKKKE